MTNLFEKDSYLKEFESKIINVNQEFKTLEITMPVNKTNIFLGI